MASAHPPRIDIGPQNDIAVRHAIRASEVCAVTVAAAVREHHEAAKHRRPSPLASGATPLSAAVASHDRTIEGTRSAAAFNFNWALVNKPHT